MLSLAEELLLLALDDDKGTVPGSVQQGLGYGLAAAGIVELMVAGRLATGEKQRVAVVDAALTGNEIQDEMIARIQRSRRPKSVGAWVQDFGNGGIKKLQERLENRLVERGTLRVEEGKFLRIFPWHHYPTVDGSEEVETRERLREILLGDAAPDAETAVLVSLVRACKLVDQLFPKEERKRAEQRAKEISTGQFAGEAVSKAVEEAAAAAMAAVIAATVAATASTTTTTS